MRQFEYDKNGDILRPNGTPYTIWDLERLKKQLDDPRATVTEEHFAVIESFEGASARASAIEKRAQLLASLDLRSADVIIAERKQQITTSAAAARAPAPAPTAISHNASLEATTKQFEAALFGRGQSFDRAKCAERIAAEPDHHRLGYSRRKFLLATETLRRDASQLTDEDFEQLECVNPSLAEFARRCKTAGGPPDWDDFDRTCAQLPVSFQMLTSWFRAHIGPSIDTLHYRSREARQRLAKIDERLEQYAERDKSLANLDETIKESASSKLEQLAQRLNSRIESLSAATHERLKKLEVTPQFRYAGVWSQDERYHVGNFVTHAGSLWHANVPSKGTKPGTAPETWTLAVKRGQDAR